MFQNKIYFSFQLNLILIALISIPNELAKAKVQFSPQETEIRVSRMLNQMTLEQKIGQMVQANINHITPKDVSKYYLGSIQNRGRYWPATNQSSVDDWLRLADAYHKASLDKTLGGAGIPIIWGTDAVHGHNNLLGATIFPSKHLSKVCDCHEFYLDSNC